MKPDNPKLKLGLMANRVQFTILVIVNAFVGAMVGMERSIFPEFALSTFGIKENTAVLSFIIAFGISKAFANFFTGNLIQVFGRKPILVFGWIMALPVPFLLLLADKWSWIIIANILLGISQGLTWSCTVIMKIDLVGSKDRGLAMGINEFAGYLSIGIMALFSGWLVDYYDSVQPVFYFGIGVAVLGLFLSIIWVRDTSLFVEHEVISSQNQVINLNGTF